MQFFVYFTRKEGESMTPPSPEGMAKMGKFMEDSFKSGKIVATGQLPQKTIHLSLEKGKFSVTDGPFIEGKDLIPGFTIIRADSREEAVEWGKKLRECMGDGVLKMAKLSATGMDDL
jgi:hypothetical protein